MLTRDFQAIDAGRAEAETNRQREERAANAVASALNAADAGIQDRLDSLRRKVLEGVPPPTDPALTATPPAAPGMKLMPRQAAPRPSYKARTSMLLGRLDRLNARVMQPHPSAPAPAAHAPPPHAPFEPSGAMGHAMASRFGAAAGGDRPNTPVGNRLFESSGRLY